MTTFTATMTRAQTITATLARPQVFTATMVRGVVDEGSGAAPVNTVAPAITGTLSIGEVLTSTEGTWTGDPTPTYAYQWQRDGADITGATSSTYTMVAADIGPEITCDVTATNDEGSATATSNARAWTPGEITSLTHSWVAADAQQPIGGGAGAGTGDPAGYVPDSTGSSPIAAPSSAGRATVRSSGGVTYLEHDATDDYYEGALGATITRPNVWLVNRIRAAIGGQYIFDQAAGDGGNRVSFFASSTSRYLSSGLDMDLDANSTEYTQWATRLLARDAADQGETFRNNTSVDTDTVGTGADMAGIRVGARSDDALYAQLDWADIRVFDTELTSSQRADLQAWAEYTYAGVLP